MRRPRPDAVFEEAEAATELRSLLDDQLNDEVVYSKY